MTRIQKYKESLYRFIKEKSCLFETNDNINLEINTYIYKKIKKNDLIFPILTLTIMNNQNKKNHISMQGYYIASSVEFLNILLSIIQNKNEIISKFNDEYYIKMLSYLFQYTSKSIEQNIESIKNANIMNNNTNQFKSDNLSNIILYSLSQFNNTIKIINSFQDYKIVITENECNKNIIDWYLKKEIDLINKFKTFKQVSKESIYEYIEKKYVSLSEYSMIIGWIIGSGDSKEIQKLKKTAKYFANMYKIAYDFENLNLDIKNCNDNYTTNFVLNYGLQEGYEFFLNNKLQFIEELMIDDTYTNTIKEIIDILENNIDFIIDQTSPDLKSHY